MPGGDRLSDIVVFFHQIKARVDLSFLPDWYASGYEDSDRFSSYWFSALSGLIGVVLGVIGFKGSKTSRIIAGAGILLGGLSVLNWVLFILTSFVFLGAAIIYFGLMKLLGNNPQGKSSRIYPWLATATLCLGVIGVLTSFLFYGFLTSISEDIYRLIRPFLSVGFIDDIGDVIESFWLSSVSGVLGIILGIVSYDKTGKHSNLARIGIFLCLLAIMAGLPLFIFIFTIGGFTF